MRLGLLLAMFLLLTPSAQAENFESGDLLVGNFTGIVGWYRGDGTLVSNLDTGMSFSAGMEFDSAGNLLVTGWSDGKVVAFDPQGQLTGNFIDSCDPDPSDLIPCYPFDVALDASGNVYIGDWLSTGSAHKFDQTGTPLGVVYRGESDRIDLASDQCTLFVLNAGTWSVHRKDICSNEAAESVFGYIPPDGAEPQGLRILPDNTILANYRTVMFRLSWTGEILQNYYPPEGCTELVGLALGVGGDTFWSSCDRSYPIEIGVADGQVVRALPDVGGIVWAVRGGFRAGRDVPTAPLTTIALTPPSPNGNNGWYVSAVTAVVSATDTGSGVSETRCVLDPDTAPATFDDLPAECAFTGGGSAVSEDGEHTLYAASRDNDDNEEKPVVSSSFKIDQTDPVVVVTGVADGATYTLGAAPTAGCDTIDALSNVKTPAALSVSGGPIGLVTATCGGAEDEAGNTGSASATYTVTSPPATCNGLEATIVASAGQTSLNGTNGNDVIVATTGPIKIHAKKGNDTICTGDGNDRIFGDDGNDWVDAGNGNNFVKGGAGNDSLKTGAGDDQINGDGGTDSCTPGGGTNKVKNCKT